MLALVLADRHPVGLVEQDVRGLQHRVGEQPDGGPVGAVPGRLVLELGHPARLAEPGDAAQHPLPAARARAPGTARTRCTGPGPARARAAARRRCRVRGGEQLRVVLDGDRVQVRDEVERVVVVLQGHPLPQRAEVVAEVERVRGRLDAGQHPRAGIGGGGHGPILSATSDRSRGDARPTPPGQFCPSGTAMSVTSSASSPRLRRLPVQQVDPVQAGRCRPPAGWPARSPRRLGAPAGL